MICKLHVNCSKYIMSLSNGNIFHVTGPLCGNSPVTGEFPIQRPVTRSFDVFFELRLNKWLSKQSWAGDLRRHCTHYDVIVMILLYRKLLQTMGMKLMFISEINPHIFPINIFSYFIVNIVTIVSALLLQERYIYSFRIPQHCILLLVLRKYWVWPSIFSGQAMRN